LPAGGRKRTGVELAADVGWMGLEIELSLVDPCELGVKDKPGVLHAPW